MRWMMMALAMSVAGNVIAARAADSPRLNEMQFVSTHNSYHQAPDRALLDYLRRSGFAEGGEWTGPKLARAIDYAREPLPAQFDMGVRAIELDVHDDPDGTRFTHPAFLDALAAWGAGPDRPWDPSGELRRPGFKALHKPGYDPRSSCPMFARCLAQIADWSDRHPGHDLLTLMIEIKPAPGLACDGLCDDGWRRLKRELIAGLGRARILTPLAPGAPWPRLDEARGRVLVMLLDSEAAAASYRHETERRGDDIIFTARRPAKKQPLTQDGRSRIAILPDPRDPRIAQARKAGMLVYTRADADTEEARADDPRRRDAAFASGATFIGTDYPTPDSRFSGYVVRFPDGGYVRRVLSAPPRD